MRLPCAPWLSASSVLRRTLLGSPEILSRSPSASFSANSRRGGEPGQPDTNYGPNQYPDRPAPPQAVPVIEPPEPGEGPGREPHLSLMQQIVGAIKERPSDPSARSRLEEVKQRMESEQLQRSSAEGTVTVPELRLILRRVAKNGASLAVVEEVGKEFSVDPGLLMRVIERVALVDEPVPQEDGDGGEVK